MPVKDASTTPSPTRGSGSGEPPAPPAPPAPWRTEGLPPGKPPKPKRRWTAIVVALVGYLIAFSILTVQDRLSGPQAVPYTEFKGQVAKKNVVGVFARGDSIEGELKAAAAVPGRTDREYKQFTTERP